MRSREIWAELASDGATAVTPIQFDSRRLQSTHLQPASRQAEGSLMAGPARENALSEARSAESKGRIERLDALTWTMASSSDGLHRLHPSLRGRRALCRSHRRSGESTVQAQRRKSLNIHCRAPSGRDCLLRTARLSCAGDSSRKTTQTLDSREKGGPDSRRLRRTEGPMRPAWPVGCIYTARRTP